MRNVKSHFCTMIMSSSLENCKTPTRSVSNLSSTDFIIILLTVYNNHFKKYCDCTIIRNSFETKPHINTLILKFIFEDFPIFRI